MPYDGPKVKAGEPGIGNQPHALMKAFADERVNTEHQLLHARRAFAPFIADDDDVSRHDFPCLDCVKCLPVSVKYFCLALHILDFLVDCRRAYNRSARRQVAS